MNDTVVIGGEISLSMTVDGYASLTITIDGVSGVVYEVERNPHETYDGDYMVIPSLNEQVLYTENKLMTDDVTITEIPYFETSNVSGTTVYIADTIGE